MIQPRFWERVANAGVAESHKLPELAPPLLFKIRWTGLSKITSCHRILHKTLNFKTDKNLDSGELDRIDSLDGWWPPENWVQEES